MPPSQQQARSSAAQPPPRRTASRPEGIGPTQGRSSAGLVQQSRALEPDSVLVNPPRPQTPPPS
jgi:hypothetical protein